MRKPDYAHKLTDKQLADLEQRIAKLYKEAADELTDTVKSYFEQFAKRDAAMQEKLEKGVRAALARLEPSEILWYGKCHEEFDWNVTRIQPYYKQVKRRCKNGW